MNSVKTKSVLKSDSFPYQNVYQEKGKRANTTVQFVPSSAQSIFSYLKIKCSFEKS
jgi:hypothetical protein